MELKFFSIDEVKEFVKQLKGARGGKSDNDDTSGGLQTGQPATGGTPAPLMPPTGAQGFSPNGTAGFVAPVGGAAFPASNVPAVSPEAIALASRINARIDGAIASGQPADQVLTWFRNQCGPEASQASLDQLKTMFLPRLSVPALEGIAKLMAA